MDAGTPQAPVPPVVPRKLLGDITFEGLLRHFDEGDPSIGIFADEGGQFFGGHGMGRDNQLKTAAGLSKLWDAAPLNRTRAGSPQATYRHRRGSLYLMIQPGVAETVLSNQILRDQGLLSRMLIAWPRSRIGQRLIVLSAEQVERHTRAEVSLRSYHERISKLLNQTARSNSVNLELRPRTLKLSSEAKNLLICFANQVETEQGPSQRLASITGFASKAAEQAARIAAILSVYANPDCVEIDLEGMERGVQIASWYIGEAQRLLDAGPGNELLEKAQKLLDWLQHNYRDRAFNTREVQRGGPPSLRAATTIRALLKVLESHHQIQRCNGPTSVNGTRTKEAW